MASSLISTMLTDAPTFTTTQCSICDLAWDLLPFECVCNTLPLITAPPYVYNPDAVHLTPTANVADVYAQCDVCGESGCECEWPRDSDGNLIPADEYCHLCNGNLMLCSCDDDDEHNSAVFGKFSGPSLCLYCKVPAYLCTECGKVFKERKCAFPNGREVCSYTVDNCRCQYCDECDDFLKRCEHSDFANSDDDDDDTYVPFPIPDILLHAKEAECIHELCGHAYLDCHCFSTLCDSNGDSIPYNEFCFRCNGSTRECDCEPLSLPVNTTKEKNWIDIYIAVQAHKFLCSIGVFHRNSYSQTIIPREYGDVCPQ